MSQESNNALIQQLKKHYSLSLDLFGEESAFFFEGAQRQHNLETLRHLSSFGDMVLFLTGDKGSGKTTLLKRLQESSFEGLNVIFLDAERLINGSQGQARSVFSECAHLLDFKVKGGEAPLEILTGLLKECHRLVASDGLRTLIAFDNADKLSKKDLQLLFSFCRNLPPESALVMLFAGASSLLQWTKSGSNLEQAAWCHQIQLKPLSQADVFSYLEQALAAAQYAENLELSESQLQQLSDLGKGLPGRVNKLFPSVVLEPGLLKIQPRKKNGFPMQVLFGIAGLLILSFVFVSYQHGIFDRIIPVFSLEDEPKEVNNAVSDVAKSQKVDLVDKNRQQKTRLAMLDNALKEKGLSLPEEPVEKDVPIEPMLDYRGQLLNGVNDNIKPVDSVINEVEAKVIGSSDLSRSLVDEDKQAVSKVDINKVVVRPPAKVEVALDAKVLNKAFKSKDWLLAQPRSSYMAQILGSYQEQTALKFIKKIDKQKFEVYYLETEHKGKPWYVVFYGVFPAKTHAQDAVKNAPKMIKSQNPWIRKASDVLASYPTSN